MSWTLKAAFAASAASLALAGCSSTSSTPEPAVTVTETAAAPVESPAPATTAPAPAPTKETSGDIPEPPAGAKQLASKEKDGAQYERYEISGKTPEQVVDGYESELKSDGYTITNSGGSGGGWGKWGGSGYGMDAESSGSYVSVQAGGEKGGPTYFEVCTGSSKSAVDHCNENSQNSDDDSESNGS